LGDVTQAVMPVGGLSPTERQGHPVRALTVSTWIASSRGLRGKPLIVARCLDNGVVLDADTLAASRLPGF